MIEHGAVTTKEQRFRTIHYSPFFPQSIDSVGPIFGNNLDHRMCAIDNSAVGAVIQSKVE